MSDQDHPTARGKASHTTRPDAQPPISDEPPIPDADELPGTPRPAIGRDNKPAPSLPKN